MKFRDSIIALSLLLGMLMDNNRAFAGDSDALLSVSLTNGTPVIPRSIFTQTWTFTNNGTTTWTPGVNGYTLNLIGLDSLGAIPLVTNINGGTTGFPRAAINSGKNVAPGGTAGFSMEFIAPEATGSYTDSFQLNSSSSVYFGPTVTLQVAVEPGGNTNVYDRSRAISFANNYAAYFCPDGYFWTNGSSYVVTNPDIFALAPSATIVVGDDSAHFVSYCIGGGPYVQGGGMSIADEMPLAYGQPGPPKMINDVLLGSGSGVQVSSLSELSPGDVIGWNWEGETNGTIDHVTLYMGNGLVTWHSQCYLDISPSYFGKGPVTVPGTGWAWHLIHILDYPTLWSSMSGRDLTFSWTTNWAAYALYSAPALNGTWTMMTTNPTVTGITNSITVTMPGSGSAFYRLIMP